MSSLGLRFVAPILAAALLACTQTATARVDQQPAASQLSQAQALKEPTNAELVQLMVGVFRALQKPAVPLRVAVAGNDYYEDLDLTTWPGTLVGEALRRKEEECGIPVQIVSVRNDYRLLIALKPMAVVNEETIREKVYQEFRTIIGEELDKRRHLRQVQFIDGFMAGPTITNEFESSGFVEGAEYRLLPQGFQKGTFESFRRHLRDLEAARNEPDRFQRLREDLVTYFSQVTGRCPRKNWARRLESAGFRVSDLPDLLERVMRDERIRVGMTIPEFAAAARQILDEFRPGR